MFKKLRGAGKIVGVREAYRVFNSRTISIANVKPQEVGILVSVNLEIY